MNASTAQIDNHTAAFGPDAPWFVHLSFVSPHPPSTPPRPWDRAFGSAAMPPLNYAPGDIDALPHQTRMLLGLLVPQLSLRRKRKRNGTYATTMNAWLRLGRWRRGSAGSNWSASRSPLKVW